VPDLDGRWVGSISSNWATIADKHGLLDQSGKSYEDHPIPVNASIRIRLLNISMELNSDDNYQNSKTLNCTLKRNSHDGFCLSYIYQSTVPHPKESDEQSFYGAALFDIQDRTPLEITGNHWTNRNWQAGLNTAGMIVLQKA